MAAALLPVDSAVALIDREGSSVWCNEPFSVLLARLSDAPSAGWATIEAFVSVVESSRRSGDTSRAAARLATRDGAFIDVEIVCAPGEFGESAVPMHSLVIEALRDREDSVERLRRSHDELVRFQYHVSHDLAAPIIAARGLLGLMGEDLASGALDELPELVDEAIAQLGRLDGLIADLISLSGTGTPGSRREAIDIRELVDDIVDSLVPSRRLLPLSVTVNCERPELEGDRTRLRQILANLIANAHKFRDPEQAAPWIEIELEHRPDGYLLRVGDNGIGMDEDVADRAFDMFSRGEHERPGHGLGLYIVAQHLERLGGKATVRSRRHPTRIELMLPRAA